MSGDEADESSVGDTSYEDDDTPLPISPFKSGTDEPFKIVFKGGRPWGFGLKGGTESKAPLQISQIETDGKAAQGGQLQVDDHLISINDVRCSSIEEAEQLIQSAFRTLTLLVWRGTSEPVKSPVQSSSFLLKARELQERARQQAAAQDDSAVYNESKSATSFRMKPRQRRIESFHGRRGSTQSASSLSSSSSASKQPQRRLSPRSVPVTNSPPTSSTDSSGLKGWATENDLTSGHQPIIMSSRYGPLASAKSTPSLNQDELQTMSLPQRGFSPSSHQASSMTKSSPDVSEQGHYENLTSPLSPKSPSWYQQRFPNRSSVFDFSSSAIRRNQGSPRNSYAGFSPSYSQSSNFPTSSVHSNTPVSNTGVFSATYMDSNSYRASHSHFSSGSSLSSYDDTPSREQKKNYDRRSLPPQALYNFRQEIQKENIKPEAQSQKHLKSMPTTKEENELDSEITGVPQQLSSDLDIRPVYSPPAPPVRDISSLKYVGFNQNHEKYPSWPVTTANPPSNLGPVPVNIPVKEKDDDKLDTESSKENKSETQISRLSDKSSPSSDRRGSDETKQPRNASDPGFKQKPKKSFYTTRKPKFEPTKERDYENLKSEEERFNDFCNQSKPGYPPPKFDPDGHNYGDEKYNIPSPPERDVPNSDEKFEISLVEKINSVINPGMQYHSFPYHHHPSANSEGFFQKSRKIDMATSPLPNSSMSKIPGMYFQQAMNSQNLLHLPNQSKNMVDSGTSPLSSPNEEKGKPGFRTLTTNPRSESFQTPSAEKSRGLIIRQMPYYNTSTQTEDYQAKPFRNSADTNDPNRFMEKSVQAHMSHSSLNSDSETNSRTEKYLRKDFASDSHLNQPTSLSSGVGKSETSSQSSGIGSMNLSDQSSAPMLRKLSEEFYRGKLGVSVSNEKRISATNYDELKSPRSESTYSGGLKEAESLSSVVIHPHESAGPFGHDDFGSSPSLTSSKQDFSDYEHDHFTDPRHNFVKARHSVDAANIFHKATTSMSSLPPRNLQESRFISENNLSSSAYSSRNYSQSMLQLSKPPSVSDKSQKNSGSHSSDSLSSRPHGSMEARSSGSRISSDSSTSGIVDQRSSVNMRKDSDSVFFDRISPGPSETNKGKSDDQKEDDKQNVGIGRKVSMKIAYGTFDESEHHYATPYAHQRNNSENLSPQAKESVAHARSQSYTDYMPMHYSLSPADLGKLGQIQEEDSEMRWQEAVRKSKSGNHDVSNYMNVDSNKEQKDSNYVDKKNGKTKTGMKRTVSEQIRAPKNEAKKLMQQSVGANKEQSSGEESSKGNKSDSEILPNTLSHHYSDSDLKKVQQKAVLDFVERKTNQRASDSSEPQSPIAENSPSLPQNVDMTRNSPVSPSLIMMDITRKYNYTKAQRAESLRRTRSITSNSSYDSTDYVDMKRPERNYQTEWSRLRSKDGAQPRRPLSVGSDISGTENCSTKASLLSPSEEEATHMRNGNETGAAQMEASTDPASVTGNQQTGKTDTSPAAPTSKNDNMVTTPIYQNLGEYPRRPPPPVPGVNNEDQPPALPPRSYQQPRFMSSKSESFLFAQMDQQQAKEIRDAAQRELTGHKKWENSPQEDSYAEQLRKQARRYSEQHKPMSMQVLATKSPIQVSLSQSFKQEPVQPFEAKPLQKYPPPSIQTDSDKVKELHSSPQKCDTVNMELPPLPTPLKNGEVEIKVDLNETADFPPPPAEFAEDGDTNINDGCADDSYGSYKTRTSRELGKYKRTVSDSNVVKAHAESRLQAFTELNSNSVSETPSKPPRKKLELQERESPNQGQGLQSGSQGAMVPSFQATESAPVGAQKSVAQPLETAAGIKQSTQMAGNAGSFISTVVQRPSANLSVDRSSNQQDEHVPSVKDRIKSIEVISHSPGSAKSGQKTGNVKRIDGLKASFEGESRSDEGTPRSNSDSLEKLESSVRSSGSFRDRLRPVVRKVDKPNTEEKTPYIERSHENSDRTIVEGTPPVPVRTYKNIEGQHSSDRPPRPSAKPREGSESPYRRNSFQFRNSAVSHPRPYENKNEPGANIQNQVWVKHDNIHSEKSVPDPQVPSRVPLRPKPFDPQRVQPHEHFSSDQNQVSSSRNQRLSGDSTNKNDMSSILTGHSPGSSSQLKSYDNPNLQSYSVQIGHKRKSDNSFTTRLQNTSSGSPNINTERVSSPDSQSQTRPSDNVQYDRYQNSSQLYSQSGDKKGSFQRTELGVSTASVRTGLGDFDRSPAQPEIRYQSGDYKHWRTQNEKARVDDVAVKSSPESQGQFVSNSKQEYSYTTTEEKQNRKNLDEKQRTSGDNSKDNTAIVNISHQRVPSHEELECDEKAHELARVLQDSDKHLSQVLSLDSSKSRMQYMDGIFSVESEPVPIRPRSASKKESSSEEKEQEEQKEEPTSPMPSNYYVSPPKAMIELEIRKFGDTNPLTQGIGDNDSLAQKKEELLQRMVKKVDILKDDKKELLSEIEENEKLGKQVADAVEQKCRSHQEKEKFRSYIEDMEKIIRLLLKLSGLLARAENTIQGLSENTNEKIKKMTYDKRDRLHKQYEDAKELKLDIDRRRENVEGILKECLSTSELEDYHYFIKMKSKYTIQMQELEDKITLGNEQITALQKSIPNKNK